MHSKSKSRNTKKILKNRLSTKSLQSMHDAWQDIIIYVRHVERIKFVKLIQGQIEIMSAKKRKFQYIAIGIMAYKLQSMIASHLSGRISVLLFK